MKQQIVTSALLVVVMLLGSGLSHARNYNAYIGRFQTMDTYEGSPQDPQSLHKYVYCNGDPVNNSDPSGNFAITEALGSLAIFNLLAQITIASPTPTATPTSVSNWIKFNGYQAIWYSGILGDTKKPEESFPATSGSMTITGPTGDQIPDLSEKAQSKEDMGPIPEGDYSINLIPDPNRVATIGRNGRLQKNTQGGGICKASDGIGNVGAVR